MIKLDEKNLLAYESKSRLLIDIKRYENALNTIKRAMEFEKYSPMFYYYKALSFDGLNKNNEALRKVWH